MTFSIGMPSLVFLTDHYLSVETEVFTQFTMLNKEESSAKSLTSEFSPSVYINEKKQWLQY